MGKLPFEDVKRKILAKKEAKTSPNYGCFPDKRPVTELITYGIVNIDKPAGPTSHQVSDYLQRILGITKAGHSGTLDPGVTGVLPIALGRATRIVETLLTAGKEYVAVMHLHGKIEEDEIRKTLKGFVGKIKQIPPLKSSVKRVEREREIYYLDILEIDGQDILFRVGCQAGTYIRTLCHQIGQKIGCGAHMAELRRTKAGPFGESSLVTLQDLTDALWYYKNEGNENFIRKVIQPVENAVAPIPKIWVFDTTVNSLCHGSDLKMPGISKLNSKIKKDDLAAIMTLKDELICLGKARFGSEQIKRREKGVAVKVEKVFMAPGSYPKT